LSKEGLKENALQMQTMEMALRNELREGEELIWSGRPIKYERQAISSRRRLLQNRATMSLVLGLILMLVAMIIEIAIGDLPAGRESFLLLPGFLLFWVGVCRSFSARIVDFLFFPQFYAITNLRIILFWGSNPRQILSFQRRAIKQVCCSERPDGSGDLLFSGTPVASGMFLKGVRRKENQYLLRAIPHVRLVEQELFGGMGQEKNE
jgi:hypothetical protein